MEQDQIIKRLSKLYDDLPVEYCGYALSAIEDIEKMLNQKPIAEITQAFGDIPEVGTKHYDTPKMRQRLTEDEIIWLVPGLIDSLADPYEQVPNDTFSSIKIDMIRLARAVEDVYGILDNESEVCYNNNKDNVIGE